MNLNRLGFSNSLKLEIIKTIQIIAREFPCLPTKIRKNIEDHIILFFQHNYSNTMPQPRTIGAVLVYFYGTNIFASREINPCYNSMKHLYKKFQTNYQWFRKKRRLYLEKLNLMDSGYYDRYNSNNFQNWDAKPGFAGFGDNSINNYHNLFDKKRRKKNRKDYYN